MNDMKTIRFLIVALALTAGATQVQAQGFLGRIKDAVKTALPKTEQPAPEKEPAPALTGVTPRQLMYNCPALPTVDELVVTNVGYDLNLQGQPFREKHQRAMRAIEKFHREIDSLQVLCRQMKDRANKVFTDKARADGNRLADQTARQMTGRSAAELQNMSDKELEAMGRGITAHHMEASGSGASIAELQAMAEKGDQEGIMKAMSGVQVPTGGQTPTSAGGLNYAADPAYQRIRVDYDALTAANNAEIAEISKELKRIYEKHEKAIAEKALILQDYTDGKVADMEGYPPAQRNWELAMEAYLTECFNYLRDRTDSMKSLTLSYAVIHPEVDAPTADPAGMIAYDMAYQYLELASQIERYQTMLPGDETNDEEPKIN